MATNYIQPGKTLTIPAPSNVASNQFVVIGSIFGVAPQAADVGQPMDLVTEGVFELPKAPAAVFTVGEDVFWNGTAADEDSTAGDLRIGVCVEAAGNGATSMAVRLSGHF